MNWVKENKIEAGLLALAIAAGIGAYFLAGSKSEQYDDAKESFDMAAGQLRNLESRKPYPSAGKLEDRKKEVVEYRGKVEGLQKALLTYRPEEFKKIRPAEFTTKMNEVGQSLHALYDSRNIVYPAKWQMGFEVYTASPPKDEATDYLNYQLEGLQWLFAELAAAGPAELLNVYLAPLPVEQGKPMMPKGASKPYHELPVEITFRGRERALRGILSSLASSKNHFFVVRSLRVQNSKMDKAPRSSDVKFEDAPVGLPADDPFKDLEGFVFPDDAVEPADPAQPGEGVVEPEPVEPEPAPAPPAEAAAGERVLGQVLGAEELHVFLQLDLILFRDNVNLPEIK